MKLKFLFTLLFLLLIFLAGCVSGGDGSVSIAEYDHQMRLVRVYEVKAKGHYAVFLPQGPNVKPPKIMDTFSREQVSFQVCQMAGL